MPIGAMHKVHIHEDADGVVVFDRIVRTEINHNDSFTVPTTTVFKEDFTGSTNDAFTVQYAYPAGSEPDLTAMTIEDLRKNASDAVNAFFGTVEADPSAT